MIPSVFLDRFGCFEMLAILILYPTGASGIIVLIKNNQEILLDHADFALQEQPEKTSVSWLIYHGR